MDEEKKIEESANTFLKSFFDATYNDNKILFDNMQNIYALISFLYNNMQYLDVETQDLRTSTRKDYVAKSKLINDFYKNQPPEKRDKVNDILTELVAFTEELIYTDYLKQIGYEKEATMFNIEEYKNLHNYINCSHYVIKITLLYYLLGKVSKESYLLLYKNDKDYDKALKIFDEEKNKNQNIIFLSLYYSVGIISFYNYIEYKKDPNFLEKIKKLKENIDVLTLTATPIPRTLHMSLIGIRDMSVLEEAPNERMPIQTYVMEYNDEMVREAITRELARDGQVYYVYNRVNDIADVAGRIQSLVPDANVAFAHGQMKERELEDIMYDFINGDIDVLVSTTIIETGLDIPNANTMIIQDADRFGLSQLYQLRGRVGRSNRMAYAFLLYQRDKLLKEVAEKRLSAIREFTDLGSGIKIAMRDLEIRGAGNLLGEAQSGHMEAVGYDLYCKMLNEAVRQLKGGPEAETFTTLIDLNVDAYIPEYYIKNEYQKLDIYKRIAAIESEEELEDMTEELIDRFGDIPKKVQQLLVIASLKSLAHSVYVTAIEQKGEEIRFTMYEKAKIDPSGIPKFLDSYKNDLIFRAEEPPYFLYCRKGRNKKSNTENVLDTVRRILEDLKKLT